MGWFEEGQVSQVFANSSALILLFFTSTASELPGYSLPGLVLVAEKSTQGNAGERRVKLKSSLLVCPHLELQSLRHHLPTPDPTTSYFSKSLSLFLLCFVF